MDDGEGVEVRKGCKDVGEDCFLLGDFEGAFGQESGEIEGLEGEDEEEVAR